MAAQLLLTIWSLLNRNKYFTEHWNLVMPFNLIFRIIFILLFLHQFTTTAYSFDQDIEFEAKTCVNNYFLSLNKQDLHQLKNVTGGKHLQLLNKILSSNSSHKDFLFNYNSDLKYEIISINTNNPQKIYAIVLLDRGGVKEKIQFSIVREDGILKIIDEKQIL